MPQGKKVKFTAKQLAEIEAMAAAGSTQTEIALSLGLCREFMSRHKKVNEEFRQALERGQAKGITTIENSLFKKAKGGDTTSMIFFLCNRSREKWKNVNKAADDANTETDKLVNAISQLIAKMPG